MNTPFVFRLKAEVTEGLWHRSWMKTKAETHRLGPAGAGAFQYEHVFCVQVEW